MYAFRRNVVLLATFLVFMLLIVSCATKEPDNPLDPSSSGGPELSEIGLVSTGEDTTLVNWVGDPLKVELTFPAEQTSTLLAKLSAIHTVIGETIDEDSIYETIDSDLFRLEELQDEDTSEYKSVNISLDHEHNSGLLHCSVEWEDYYQRVNSTSFIAQIDVLAPQVFIEIPEFIDADDTLRWAFGTNTPIKMFVLDGYHASINDTSFPGSGPDKSSLSFNFENIDQIIADLNPLEWTEEDSTTTAEAVDTCQIIPENLKDYNTWKLYTTEYSQNFEPGEILALSTGLAYLGVKDGVANEYNLSSKTFFDFDEPTVTIADLPASYGNRLTFSVTVTDNNIQYLEGIKVIATNSDMGNPVSREKVYAIDPETIEGSNYTFDVDWVWNNVSELSGTEPFVFDITVEAIDVAKNSGSASGSILFYNPTPTNGLQILNTENLNFGAVEIGRYEINNIEVFNFSETDTFIVESIEVVNSEGFSLVALPYQLPITVYAQERFEFEIEYRPQPPAGENSGALRIEIANGEPSIFEPLSGTGLESDFYVTPNPFGFEDIWASSDTVLTQTFTLHNEGDVPAVIESIRIEGDTDVFTITYGSDLETISSASTDSVIVQFDPSDVGDFAAVLYIDLQNLEINPETNISGRGVQPELSFNNLGGRNFGLVSVGDQDTLLLELRNTGTGTATYSMVMGDTESPLSVEPTSASEDLSILEGETQEVAIIFNPTSAGDYSNNLRIVSTNCEKDTTLEYLGSAPLQVVDELNFATVSNTPVTETLEIVNQSSSALQNLQLSLDTQSNPPVFEYDETGFGTIQGNGFSVNLDITYAPTEEGDNEAVLYIIESVDDDTLAAVNLNGINGPPEAGAELEIDILDFGSVDLSTTKDSTITLSNSGTMDLTDVILSLTGDNTDQFNILSPGQLIDSLPIGETEEITIGFTPTSAGLKEATLEVRHLGNTLDTLPLSGIGFVPSPSLTPNPTSFDFGGVILNDTEQTTIRLTNSGNLDLTDINISFEDSQVSVFDFESGHETTSIAQEDFVDLVISFTPTAVDDYDNTIVIEATELTANVEIEILGAGEEANPSLLIGVDSPVDFNQVVNGLTSDTTFTISNDGNVPLTGITIVPDPSGDEQFTIVDGGTVPDLDVDDSHNVTIRFAPDDVGNFSRDFTIHITEIEEVVMEFTGEGVAANPSLSSDPASPIDFGDVPFGGMEEITVTLTNDGNVELTGFTVAFESNTVYTITSGSTIPTLSPSDDHDIVVQYAPTGAGNDLDNLTISSDDLTEDFIVAFTGNGVENLSLTSDMTQVTFPNTSNGSTSDPVTITLTNSGNVDLTDIDAVLTTGTNFEITTTLPIASLEVGAQTTLEITFSPTAEILFEDTLTITTNQLTGEDAIVIPLSGTGIAAARVSQN